MKNPLVFGTLLCAVATACGGSSQRSGARYPALPAGCPVEFIANTAEKDMASYAMLGSTTLASDGFTAGAKESLQELTCEWGGDAVSIMSSSSSIVASGTTFLIHKKREAVPADTKLACLGKFTNVHGAFFDIKDGGATTMTFQTTTATCQARPLGGSKLVIACDNGMNQEGEFSGDCSTATFGGLAFSASK